MIYLNKNSLNTVVFTLNEKTTLPLSATTYLMEIYSDSDHDTKVLKFTGDTSFNPNRYNEFVIEETTSEDLSLSKITLEPGQYDYFIWQTSAATMALSAATSIVESGKLKVEGSGTTSTTYSQDNDEYTFN